MEIGVPGSPGAALPIGTTRCRSGRAWGRLAGLSLSRLRLLGGPKSLRAAAHFAPKVTIEKSELAKAASKGHFDNGLVCLSKFMTGGLQAKVVEKVSEALSDMLLELPAKSRL